MDELISYIKMQFVNSFNSTRFVVFLTRKQFISIKRFYFTVLLDGPNIRENLNDYVMQATRGYAPPQLFITDPEDYINLILLLLKTSPPHPFFNRDIGILGIVLICYFTHRRIPYLPVSMFNGTNVRNQKTVGSIGSIGSIGMYWQYSTEGGGTYWW